MAKQYYFNGKPVESKKSIPKGSILTRTVNEEWYCDEEYRKQMDKNAYEYFKKQREIREDMDAYHG